MGITPSVCNHHSANNQHFSCRSINPQDRSDELLHHRLINMLQAVKTLITVDLMAEHAGDVAKAVMCDTVTFRLLLF